MKKLVTLSILSILLLPAFAKETVEIKAGKSVDLTYSEFLNYDLRLSNRSGKQINVFVLDAESKKQIKGFGLARMGSVELMISEGEILRLKNPSKRNLSISIDFIEKKRRTPTEDRNEYVNLTLHNSSLASIPLVIPEVMNPNLSPLSNSGVSLKRGQKIYYKKGLSKKVLLILDDSIESGDKIDVARLIQKLEKGL